MEAKIRRTVYQFLVADGIVKQAAKDGIKVGDDGTEYYAAFVDDKIVGVVGYRIIGKVLRYKSDWVHPAFRGKGIYKELFKYRDVFALMKANIAGIKTINAYCSPMSISYYLKQGFIQKSFIEKSQSGFLVKEI